MITIYYESIPTKTYYIGNSKYMLQDKIEIKNISHIEASGKELDLIVNLFTADFGNIVIPSIPLAKNTSEQIWWGDIAKTIISAIGMIYC